MPKPVIAETGDGDIWGSDEENIQVYADLHRAHHNQGYLDGIVNQQEHSLQRGFDAGFPQGALLGREVGKLLANRHGTETFELIKKELNIAKVLDKKYFDDQLDPLGEHALLVKYNS